MNIWNAPSKLSASRLNCDDIEKYDWGYDHSEAEKSITGGVLTVNSTCVPYNQDLDGRVNSQSFTAVTWKSYRRYGSQQTESLFTDHPDAASFNIIHSFATRWMDTAISNPRTIVRDADDNVGAPA